MEIKFKKGDTSIGDRIESLQIALNQMKADYKEINKNERYSISEKKDIYVLSQYLIAISEILANEIKKEIK